MAWGKKKKREEELEEDTSDDDDNEDLEDIEDEPQPKKVKDKSVEVPTSKSDAPNVLTKEEVLNLLAYHQRRALELLDFYARMP